MRPLSKTRNELCGFHAWDGAPAIQAGAPFAERRPGHLGGEACRGKDAAGRDRVRL
ncbi:hypothetical protein F220043C3_16470 [Enterocloster asparagiformis]